MKEQEARWRATPPIIAFLAVVLFLVLLIVGISVTTSGKRAERALQVQQQQQQEQQEQQEYKDAFLHDLQILGRFYEIEKKCENCSGASPGWGGAKSEYYRTFRVPIAMTLKEAKELGVAICQHCGVVLK